MANTTTIILKNSGTTGNTPTAANLEFGELALNYADGLLFYKAANGTVLSISGSGGGGGTGNGSAAFDQANLAFAQANVANTTAVAAFAQANTANTTAVAAFARANAANLIANLAFDKANTANVFAVAAFAQANTAYSGAVLKTGNTMTGQLIMSPAIASTSQNTGSIVVNGGVGISGNIYISNVSSYGFANTSNVSVAKIQYNAACNSIDFVFG
jgi:hypothetical protein